MTNDDDLIRRGDVLAISEAFNSVLDHMQALGAKLTAQTARAEAAEAREKSLLANNQAERETLIRHNAAHAAQVAEITAKLEAATGARHRQTGGSQLKNGDVS